MQQGQWNNSTSKEKIIQLINVPSFIVVNILLQQLIFDKKLNNFVLHKLQLGVQVVKSVKLLEKKDLIKHLFEECKYVLIFITINIFLQLLLDKKFNYFLLHKLQLGDQVVKNLKLLKKHNLIKNLFEVAKLEWISTHPFPIYLLYIYLCSI